MKLVTKVHVETAWATGFDINNKQTKKLSQDMIPRAGS